MKAYGTRYWFFGAVWRTEDAAGDVIDPRTVLCNPDTTRPCRQIFGLRKNSPASLTEVTYRVRVVVVPFEAIGFVLTAPPKQLHMVAVRTRREALKAVFGLLLATFNERKMLQLRRRSDDHLRKRRAFDTLLRERNRVAFAFDIEIESVDLIQDCNRH